MESRWSQQQLMLIILLMMAMHVCLHCTARNVNFAANETLRWIWDLTAAVSRTRVAASPSICRLKRLSTKSCDWPRASHQKGLASTHGMALEAAKNLEVKGLFLPSLTATVEPALRGQRQACVLRGCRSFAMKVITCLHGLFSEPLRHASVLLLEYMYV